jgi:hypothetical protein
MAMSQAVQDAVQANNWRDAVKSMISERIAQNRCFSSGELAAELRTECPALSFSVRSLGDYVRDMFYAGGMELYDDGQGGMVPPCQIPCITQGIGRTPSGQTVFVYGPDPGACAAHNFEVDIPAPPGQQVSVSSAPAVAAFSSNTSAPVAFPSNTSVAPSNTPVVITGAQAPQALPQATVHTDARLCVPRGAFEALVQALQHVMRGGDPVYTSLNGNLLELRLDAQPGYTKYDLSATRGRVLITHAATAFNPGDKYRITIVQDTLQIDLSQPV